MTHQAHGSQTRREVTHKRQTTQPVRRRPAERTATTDLARLQCAVEDVGRARPADILAL